MSAGVMAQTGESTSQAESRTTESTGTETAPEDAPKLSETDQVQPGDIREAVSRSLELFVPSEEIDVDKPVDFPTNI
jgi:hypothetical protein